VQCGDSVFKDRRRRERGREGRDDLDQQREGFCFRRFPVVVTFLACCTVRSRILFVVHSHVCFGWSRIACEGLFLKRYELKLELAKLENGRARR